MFNTFIYGSPLGFDFFEDVASLKDYFKGFYISSRKGRRLMVNRRDNGDTIYSYLRYGLAEKEGRPNSFFGMSVSISDNEYAYNFKEIFEWFDYLFDMVVERGIILHLNSENILQYRISKFKEAADEVNWLKGNIPNLFIKRSNDLSVYDSSFQNSNSGQIKCFNDETDAQKLIAAFRSYRWIAISPEFKQEEEPFEMSLSETTSLLNSYTQRLVPIAISPDRTHLRELEKIDASCLETIDSLKKYSASNPDPTIKEEADALSKQARTICINVASIKAKIPKTDNSANEFKVCRKCGNTLHISAFRSPASQICMSCEHSGNTASKRKCNRCGQIKDSYEFEKGSQVCRACASKSSFWNSLSPEFIGAVAVLALIIVVSLFIIFRSNDDPVDNPDGKNIEAVTPPENNNVDAASFYEFISAKNFEKACECIDGKADSDQYKGRLHDAIETHIWTIFEKSELSNLEAIVREFFVINSSPCRESGVEQEKWMRYVDDYTKLNNYWLKKSPLSKNEETEVEGLIKSLPFDQEGDRDEWRQSFAQKRTQHDLAAKKSKERAAPAPATITVTVDGKTVTYNKSANLKYPNGKEITVESIQKLSVSGPQGTINPIDAARTKFRLKIKLDKVHTVEVGNIKLTIKGEFKKSNEYN